MRYAEVALNVPVRKSFTYHIPAELAGRLMPGALVRVEFGVAMQPGVILAFHDKTDIPQTKPVIELLDPEPALSERGLELAAWLSESCLAPIGACVWLLLPPGFTGKSDRLFTFLRDELDADQPQQLTLPGADPKAKAPLPRRLLDMLRDRGPRRLRQLKSAIPKQPVEAALEALEGAGMVASESVLAPPAARAKTEQRLYPNYGREEIAVVARTFGKSSQHADLLALLAERDEDAMAVSEALRAVGAKTRRPLNRLIDEGLVFVEEAERGEDDIIILEAGPERINSLLESWRGTAYIVGLLRELLDMPEAPTMGEAIRATGASRSAIKKLIKAGALEARVEQVWRDSLRDYDFLPDSAPELTPDQQKAWARIRPALNEEQAARFLLHGVTGSGKTEIYLRAIAEAMRLGKSAILLVPEIALTPQTVRRVSERFPGQAALIHGSLPQGERYDAWQRARRGDVSVIVGTRSALFTPLQNLGLIVLDEEHDASYKQSPGMNEPHYHARDAAAYMAERHGAVLLLGSATPDLASWHRAQSGAVTYLHLPNRIMGHRRRIGQQARRYGVEARYRDDRAEAVTIELPPVSVVDMRAELHAGNSTMFSRELQGALSDVLARGEQAMLLLNRRGQATYVFCRDCGYALECPRCDNPMTYHRVERALRCHHCGNREAPPQTCPDCNSTRIRYFGAGTQQVDEALRALYPAARTLRWDVDTASSPRMHFDILARFVKREADVLIGTQMIAKGLDLPLVTLVGVVSADIGLALPDYRAGERVFQLLTQVAGRAGRGVLGGVVVLQTYRPEHYIIQAAARHDYSGFAERESNYRRELGYPPYRRLARIVFSYSKAEAAQRQAENAAERLRDIIAARELTGTSIIGPAPCFYARLDRQYRWHLLLRGPDPRAALRELAPEPGWRIDIDPVSVL